MKIIGKYWKHFLLRGLVAMGFGPIVLAIIYVILELTNTLNNAIGDMSADSDVVNNLISIIADFGKK